MNLFIGLDLGVNKAAICVIDETGGTVLQTSVPSEPAQVIGKLSKLSGDIALVGLEACPLSEWMYGALRDAGYPVFCIETRHTQRFLSTRPNKTDRNDAHGIATMMRVGHFKPVHVKSRESQLVRSLLIGRRQFMSAMLQIENTIRSLLRTQGLKLGRVHRYKFSERVRELCDQEPMMLPAIEPLLAARDEMRIQVRELDNALERASRAVSGLQALPNDPWRRAADRASVQGDHRRSQALQTLQAGACSSRPDPSRLSIRRDRPIRSHSRNPETS